MDSNTFHEYFHKVFDSNSGKNLMNNAGESLKGAFPVLIELDSKAKEKIEVTSGELSNKFNVSTARIAVILNGLEEKGYVSRYKHEDDGRKTYVKITDLGIDELNKNKQTLDNIMNKALEGIPDSDIIMFFSVIERLLKNINEGGKNLCSNCIED